MNEEEMKQEAKDRVKFRTSKYSFAGSGNNEDYVHRVYGTCGYSGYQGQELLFKKRRVKSQQLMLDEANKRRMRAKDRENGNRKI
jgi:hypothetical protein